MGEYEIGYGKPPKHTRFQKGVCPNPRGRGKKRAQSLGDIVLDVLAAETEYRERGQVKRGSRILKSVCPSPAREGQDSSVNPA